MAQVNCSQLNLIWSTGDITTFERHEKSYDKNQEAKYKSEILELLKNTRVQLGLGGAGSVGAAQMRRW